MDRKLDFAALGLAMTLTLAGCVGLGGSRESIMLPFVFEDGALAWQLGHSASDRVQMIDEWVRPGQTVETWTELVTVQTLNKAARLGSVDDQMAAYHKDLAARCPGSTTDVIRRMPDGLLYESRVVNCQQGADEHGLARVLDGTANRFIVQYAVREAVTMTQQRRTEWVEKLMAVEILKE